MNRSVYFDARCLQDFHYRYRGVGRHSAVVVGGFRSKLKQSRQLVAVLDPALPSLPDEYQLLFDSVQFNGYAEPCRDDWFIQLSPMTHSPTRIARFLTRKMKCRAAIVYDFIPHDEPQRYLSDPAEKLRYEIRLAWLEKYDIFLAISQFSGDRLRDICGIQDQRIFNTGVAVRSTIISKSKVNRATAQKIFMVGGGDSRKNTDIVVIAHAKSTLLQQSRIELLIAGTSNALLITRWKQLHRDCGGEPTLLDFLVDVNDTEIADAYATALVTVCPSKTEGFSLPVVEANANGCPVLLSNCIAQIELIPFPEDQFSPEDDGRLSSLLEKICLEKTHREKIKSRQNGIWRKYTEEKIVSRCWDSIQSHVTREVKSPSILKGAMSKILIATPMPPDPSGVADYTAACINELSQVAEVFVATDTINPRIPNGAHYFGPVHSSAYLSGRFDRVVSVLGNSSFHMSVFDHLLQHGGASICHDARMIDFYYSISVERASKIASAEMGMGIAHQDIVQWLTDQSRLPTLFLSEIIAASRPTIVHSRVTQHLATELYDMQVEYLPFCIYRQLPDNLRLVEQRARARSQLNLSPEKLLISTFGYLAYDKAPKEQIRALRILRDMGHDAHLAFVGAADMAVANDIRVEVAKHSLQNNVTLRGQFTSEVEYRNYLSASDIGIQLRKYGLGGLSGGLLDCIAAGLPSITNSRLAEAMEVPPYVKQIPDTFEAADIVLAADGILRNENSIELNQQKKVFYAGHNFALYSKQLLKLLELD